MRARARTALSSALLLALTGCASAPTHPPSKIAEGYLGKPLFNLEMHWSTPSSISTTHLGRKATWRFDQYNLAGCTVTVHTDAAGIIRKVTWTEGCGPKATGIRP